jgi:ketosteroid isomerase-like protein
MKSIFLISLLMASPVIAQEPDSISALFHMREAERNFARESVMYGRNAAFVKNFADKSIIFTDKWLTNGRQFWKDRNVTPVVLKWEPEFMDIADSRDFGISTGPWEAQEYRPNTAPVSTGYYLTVWKKQPDGVWQVILDAGSTSPAIVAYDHKFSFPAGADRTVPNPKKVNIELVCTELMNREKQILTEWKNNPSPATYTSFLAPYVRIQRNGHLPTTNADTINIRIAQLGKTVTWRSAGSGAASSGDLGFTYGYLEIPGDSMGLKGHYVRIWKKQPEGKWLIFLEMMSLE